MNKSEPAIFVIENGGGAWLCCIARPDPDAFMVKAGIDRLRRQKAELDAIAKRFESLNA